MGPLGSSKPPPLVHISGSGLETFPLEVDATKRKVKSISWPQERNKRKKNIKNAKDGRDINNSTWSKAKHELCLLSLWPSPGSWGLLTTEITPDDYMKDSMPRMIQRTLVPLNIVSQQSCLTLFLSSHRLSCTQIPHSAGNCNK